jgi:predicted MFS family arabinose efflux permease
MQRDFRLFWLGQTGSVFGSLFTTTATGLVAVRFLRATPAQTGLLVAAASVLPLLAGLPVGALADRLSRPRRALIGCDLIGMTAVGLLACGLWFHWATIWWLIALNTVLGGVTLVVETVYFIHLRSIVAEDSLAASRARLQSTEYGAGALGRALAGPLVALSGGAAAFLIDAVSYLVSAACLSRLRAPDARRADGGGTARSSGGLFAGMRLVAGDSFLRPLMTYLAWQGLAAGATSALTAQFLIRVLALPTDLYGVPFVLTGVCGLAGSLTAARIVRRGVAVRFMATGGFVASTITAALLPFARGPVAVAVILAGCGIALPVFFGAIANIGLTSALTIQVPERVLGRALASVQTLLTLVQVTGAIAGGVLADRIGIHPALWLATFVSIGGLGLAVPLVRAGRKAPASDAAPPARPRLKAGT